jgi:AraC-like DNA-binding protein
MLRTSETYAGPPAAMPFEAAGPESRALPPPRPLSRGTARVGWLRALPQILRELGCDPKPVLAASGVAASLFDEDSNEIPFPTAGALLSHCVRVTGCPHFALLVGARFDPEALGDTARLLTSAPTVGAALRTLILNFHVLDEGAVPMFLPAPQGRAVLAHSVYTPGVPALDQIADLACAITVRLLRGLCGGSWQPLRVALPHRPPADAEPYHRILGRNVTFNAELAAVVFASSWLDQPVLGGDANRRAQLRTVAEPLPTLPAMPLSHLVRRALRPMVFTGMATEAAVARLFSVHPRTLRRQLFTEGETFLGLLNATRVDIARQLLRDTDLRIAEIAAAMHYSDATALARAFRALVGVSPMVWRRQQR